MAALFDSEMFTLYTYTAILLTVTPSNKNNKNVQSCLLIRHKIYGESISHKPLLSPPLFFFFLFFYGAMNKSSVLRILSFFSSLSGFACLSLSVSLSVGLSVCLSVCLSLSLSLSLPPCFFVSVRQLKPWGSPSVGLEGSVCNLFLTPVDTFMHYLKRYLLIGLLGFQ